MARNRSASIDSSSIWLAQNFIWFTCSLLAWFGAIFAPARVGLAGELVFSLCVAAIAIALRLPLLTTSSTTHSLNRFTAQAVWIVGCMASLNWLGALGLNAAELSSAIPAFTIVLIAELWLHVRASQCGRLPLLYRRLRRVTKWLFLDAHDSVVDAPGEPSNQLRKDSPKLRATHSGSPSVGVVSSTQIPSINASIETAPFVATGEEPDAERSPRVSGQIMRQSVEGIDENGNPFQSGEVQVHFAAGQSITNALITFCTAFAGTPTVDLEYERETDDAETSDDLSIRPLNTTPNGLRLTLRRSSAAAEVTYKLLWYAHLDESSTDSSTDSRDSLRIVLP